MIRRKFLSLLAIFLATFSSRIAWSQSEQSSQQLWSLLQNAEDTCYVILFRHALAPGTGDPPNFQVDNCSTQRNLSEEGRQQARQIGEVIRNRNIAVTRVLSSQWCRCLETAKLMDVGEVEPLKSLNSFFENRSLADTPRIKEAR